MFKKPVKKTFGADTNVPERQNYFGLLLFCTGVK
jgi:hypothetical protein